MKENALGLNSEFGEVKDVEWLYKYLSKHESTFDMTTDALDGDDTIVGGAGSDTLTDDTATHTNTTQRCTVTTQIVVGVSDVCSRPSPPKKDSERVSLDIDFYTLQ